MKNVGNWKEETLSKQVVSLSRAELDSFLCVYITQETVLGGFQSEKLHGVVDYFSFGNLSSFAVHGRGQIHQVLSMILIWKRPFASHLQSVRCNKLSDSTTGRGDSERHWSARREVETNDRNGWNVRQAQTRT